VTGKELVLHIGAPKTGTSSIQRSLRQNRHALADRGVHVPYYIGGSNHVFLPLLVSRPHFTKDLLRRLVATKEFEHYRMLLAPECRDFDNEAMGAEAVRRLRSIMRDELESIAAVEPSCLMSSEFLFELRTEEEVDALATLLKPLFEKIRIVLYVRLQHKHAASEVSQKIISGQHDLTRILNLDIKRYNYHAIATRWANAFGRQSVLVTEFSSGESSRSDVFTEFMLSIGMSMDGLQPGRRDNPSMDVVKLSLLARFNRVLAQSERADESFKLREGFAQSLRCLPCLGDAFVLPKGQLAMLRSRLATSNRKLSNEFLDGRPFQIDDYAGVDGFGLPDAQRRDLDETSWEALGESLHGARLDPDMIDRILPD